VPLVASVAAAGWVIQRLFMPGGAVLFIFRIPATPIAASWPHPPGLGNRCTGLVAVMLFPRFLWECFTPSGPVQSSQGV